MFNFLKKTLIAIFLGVIPSAFAMENNQSYRWPLSALTGLWSKIPSIPSTLGSWKIRKEAEKQNNITINDKIDSTSGNINTNIIPTNNSLPEKKVIAATGLSTVAACAYIYDKIQAKRQAAYRKEQEYAYKVRLIKAEEANITLAETLETALKLGNLTEKDAQIIKNALTNGANPNLEIDCRLRCLVGYTYKKMPPLYAILCKSKSVGKLNEVEMKIIKSLLEYKADPNIKTFEQTPLFLTIANNDSQTTELLLQYGAKANETNSHGQTPLDLALYDFTSNFDDAKTYSKNEIIKNLCNARALIVDNIDKISIFVKMVDRSFPKKCIETFITCARPSWEQDILNMTNVHILTRVKNRIIWLKKVLQTKDAEELLKNESAEYRDKIWTLIDGSKLDKDYEILVQNPNLLNSDYLTKNPEKAQEAKQNLAWQMADNIKQLNAKKMLDFSILD